MSDDRSLAKIRIMKLLEGVAEEIERVTENEWAGTFADWAECEHYSDQHFDERWVKMKQAGFGPVELLCVLHAAARAGDLTAKVRVGDDDFIDTNLRGGDFTGTGLWTNAGGITLTLASNE